MNTRWPKTITAGIMATGMIILHCTTSLVTTGPGSETVAVAGRVVDSLGQPVPQTLVMLLPALYNPLTDPAIPDSMLGITDEAGHYTMKAPGPGAYSVEAADINSNYKALVTGIKIDKKDTITVPVSVLRRPGALRVALLDTVNDASGYIYLPGTTCYARAQSGIAMVGAVPAGFIPAVCYANTAAPAKNHVIQTNLTVTSNDTQVVADVTPWKYSKKLYCNTTTGGASVSRNVYDFPVLVRLNNGNFTFSQALTSGDDIRFTKENGSPLAYEIEQWDAAIGQAAIWVKVDTVYGNDSSHFIVLYWGNSAAVGGSNSAAVFDTAAGFSGVWHLGQPAGALVADAIANGIDGVATATTTVSGAIGQAQSFNGTSSFIRTSGPTMDKLNFSENGPYSVSAWVRTNVLDSIFHGIVYKSNLQYGLQMRPQNEWEFCTFIDKSRWEMSRSPASDYSWHALTGVRNGSKQYLYIDGRCLDSSIVTLATNLARVTDQPLEIGHCPDGGTDPDRYFNGAIDEVRISGRAYGADWIKLCYMNQKENDALLR